MHLSSNTVVSKRFLNYNVRCCERSTNQRTTSTPMKNVRPTKRVLSALKSARAFCFDVDSTVCRSEGIDELAAWCKANDEMVDQLTVMAMGGTMSFREALERRLEIIKPSRHEIEEFVKSRPAELSDNVQKLMEVLRAHKKDIHLVSGGFRELILPIAKKLGISESHVHANRLLFDPVSGEYAGFDPTEFTSQVGGKAKTLRMLKDNYGYGNAVIIGDGVTDMQAKTSPSDVFIGYGGVIVRDAVLSGADWYIYDFNDICYYFEKDEDYY